MTQAIRSKSPYYDIIISLANKTVRCVALAPVKLVISKLNRSLCNDNIKISKGNQSRNFITVGNPKILDKCHHSDAIIGFEVLGFDYPAYLLCIIHSAMTVFIIFDSSL